MADHGLNKHIRRSPLILRREPFGGSLFDTHEACQIEFDGAAYDFLLDHLRYGKEAKNSDEQQLLVDVARQMRLYRQRPMRFVDSLPAAAIQSSLHTFSAPTIIDFQITGRCLQNCPHCYAASSPDAKHVPLPQISKVLDQIRELGVFQLALGGGEPLEHPDIGKILRLCHQRGIVCNLTTSGQRLSLSHLIALKRYCGAVGLSLEAVGPRYAMVRRQGFAAFERALNLLLKVRIRTVLQVTLSVENLEDLPAIVDFCLTHPALYGVIFLAYKPVGRGAAFRSPLAQASYPRLQSLLADAFARLSPWMRVGYDCCLSPALVDLVAARQDCATMDIEGCSALRGSLGITANLDVVPCTFLPDVVLGNLATSTLADLFAFSHQRKSFLTELERQHTTRAVCSTCPHGSSCLGGCPKLPLVSCARLDQAAKS